MEKEPMIVGEYSVQVDGAPMRVTVTREEKDLIVTAQCGDQFTVTEKDSEKLRATVKAPAVLRLYFKGRPTHRTIRPRDAFVTKEGWLKIRGFSDEALITPDYDLRWERRTVTLSDGTQVVYLSGGIADVRLRVRATDVTIPARFWEMLTAPPTHRWTLLEDGKEHDTFDSWEYASGGHSSGLPYIVTNRGTHYYIGQQGKGFPIWTLRKDY